MADRTYNTSRVITSKHPHGNLSFYLTQRKTKKKHTKISAKLSKYLCYHHHIFACISNKMWRLRLTFNLFRRGSMSQPFSISISLMHLKSHHSNLTENDIFGFSKMIYETDLCVRLAEYRAVYRNTNRIIRMCHKLRFILRSFCQRHHHSP